MLDRARWLAVSVLLGSTVAGAQDFGLDLSEDVDVGKPKIAVTVSPALKDAVLYVDEVEIGPVGAPVPVSKGDHTVLVQRPGYSDFTQKVHANKGTVKVSAVLKAVAEAVHLTSDPDAADIVVDGKGKGKTPKVLSLLPGRHDLRLVKDGYTDWTYTIFTRAGRDTDLNAPMKALAPPASTDKPLAIAPLLEPEHGVEADAALTARAADPNPPLYKRWYVWAGAAVLVAGATAVAIAASHHSTLAPSGVCGGACDIVVNPP